MFTEAEIRTPPEKELRSILKLRAFFTYSASPRQIAVLYGKPCGALNYPGARERCRKLSKINLSLDLLHSRKKKKKDEI